MDVWIHKIQKYRTMSNACRKIMLIKILFNGSWGTAWEDIELEEEYIRYPKIVKTLLRR